MKSPVEIVMSRQAAEPLLPLLTLWVNGEQRYSLRSDLDGDCVLFDCRANTIINPPGKQGNGLAPIYWTQRAAQRRLIELSKEIALEAEQAAATEAHP